jgi:hypothetical protein
MARRQGRGQPGGHLQHRCFATALAAAALIGPAAGAVTAYRALYLPWGGEGGDLYGSRRRRLEASTARTALHSSLPQVLPPRLILSAMSRPRLAVLHLAARRCGRLLLRAGAAARAASQRRPPAEGAGLLRRVPKSARAVNPPFVSPIRVHIP